jgi:hypothetical protein
MNESNRPRQQPGSPGSVQACDPPATYWGGLIQGRGEPSLELVVPGDGIEVDVVPGQASGGPGLPRRPWQVATLARRLERWARPPIGPRPPGRASRRNALGAE